MKTLIWLIVRLYFFSGRYNDSLRLMSKLPYDEMSKTQKAFFGTMLILNERWGEYKRVFTDALSMSDDRDDEDSRYVDYYIRQYLYIMENHDIDNSLYDSLINSKASKSIKRILRAPHSVSQKL